MDKRENFFYILL